MTDRHPLHAFERRRRPLLSIGGGLVLVYAGLFGVEAVTGNTVPKSAVSGAAYVLVFAGVLGLTPDLVERSPRLARLGAVGAGLGAVGFGGVFVVNAGQLAGVVPEPGPSWLALVNLPAMIGLLAGFPLCGLASLRTGDHPRALGALLLAPAVLFVLNIVAVGAGDSGTLSAWLGFVITLGEALAVLGVAALLGTDGGAPTGEPSRPDSTTT